MKKIFEKIKNNTLFKQKYKGTKSDLEYFLRCGCTEFNNPFFGLEETKNTQTLFIGRVAIFTQEIVIREVTHEEIGKIADDLAEDATIKTLIKKIISNFIGGTLSSSTAKIQSLIPKRKADELSENADEESIIEVSEEKRVAESSESTGDNASSLPTSHPPMPSSSIELVLK